MAVLEAWARAEVTSDLTDHHTKDKPPLRNGQFLRIQREGHGGGAMTHLVDMINVGVFLY